MRQARLAPGTLALLQTWLVSGGVRAHPTSHITHIHTHLTHTHTPLGPSPIHFPAQEWNSYLPGPQKQLCWGRGAPIIPLNQVIDWMRVAVEMCSLPYPEGGGCVGGCQLIGHCPWPLWLCVTTLLPSPFQAMSQEGFSTGLTQEDRLWTGRRGVGLQRG